MDPRQLPLDRSSFDTLAAAGLRYATVAESDRDTFAAWDEAADRGFYARRPAQSIIDQHAAHASFRRVTGVWDDRLPDPGVPVATVASWVGELTVPGGALDSWAISAVTVAPTHRRRGIARALLEGELRTAAAAGVPMASLTVSEATIYGRYGFGSATQTAMLTIDTKRAGWVGPSAPGRLGFVSLQTVADTCRDVFDRARTSIPGEFSIDDYHWGQLAGVLGDRTDAAPGLRAVRYDDEAGVPQGVVVYSVTEDQHDFTKHTVDIRYLTTATDEAYAALWRFLVELDLVATVKHDGASADEPVLWMLRDQRAARRELHDHHWLRILDVPAALEARRYGAVADLVVEVGDTLGFTGGCFRLEVEADGSGRVSATDAAPQLSLDVATLSALYLGGVGGATLARAGRVIEHEAGAVRRFDRAFRAERAPWLSFWY